MSDRSPTLNAGGRPPWEDGRTIVVDDARPPAPKLVEVRPQEEHLAPSLRRRAAVASLLDGPGWPWLAAALDAVATTLAVLLAVLWTSPGSQSGVLAALLAFPVLTVVALRIARERAGRMDVGALDDAWPLVASISLAGMLCTAVEELSDGGSGPTTVVVAWLVAIVLVSATHVAVRFARRLARVHGVSDRPTIIVGAGEVGARIGRRLAARPQYGLRPVGFLDGAAPPAELVGGRPAPVIGKPSDLVSAVRRTRARQVVFAFSAQPDRSLLPLIRACEAMDVGVSLVPRLFESTNDRMTYEPVGGLPLLGLHHAHPSGWRVAVKHGLDRAIAAVLLALVAPLMLVLAGATALTCGGRVLFRQRRVGHRGREFELLKFRTMDDAGDEPLERLSADPDLAPGGVEGFDRRTPLGRLLRRTSLDELPQLVNVLRGEMSLVGPRPERPEFVAIFSETVGRYPDRHRVRPGITGCAQVKGLRGQTSLVERVELDNFYIEHWSFVLDAKILLRTAIAVFRVPE